MHQQQPPVRIQPESELGRRLIEAAAGAKAPRLASGATVFDVWVRAYEAPPAEERRADPAMVRQGLARSAGALRGIDLDALKQELWEAREQDNPERPI